MTKNEPVVLLILDGWGHQENAKGNAIETASTPTWDSLQAQCPHTLLSCSGLDVGLPNNQMGNSEVGHLTLGSGRITYQNLTRISKDIESGNFFENKVLKQAFQKANENKRAVHILGLLSPGGVHSHENHLFACMKMARKHHSGPLYLHAFLDGRDTPPKSAMGSIEKLEALLPTMNAQLATLTGRYYAMDRDQRWERVQAAYEAITHGQAPFHAKTGIEALRTAYARQETDEFVQPTCISQHEDENITLQDGDVVIYMNFRSDRARALSYALTSPDFEGFSRGHYPKCGEFVTLTTYDKNLSAKVAYSPQVLKQGLGEYLQDLHLTQLRLAETEKYAHVTFFFNGGIEKPFQGEDRVLIPSPKVPTYDSLPEMSAPALTRALVEGILQKKHDVIVCNYANADMVGHTGNFEATVKAIECLDSCLKQVIDALKRVNGQMLITADHGNAECMINPETGQPHTAHTTALVPLIYVGNQKVRFSTTPGTLSDIAPTLLDLMGLQVPQEMTGHSLMLPPSLRET